MNRELRRLYLVKVLRRWHDVFGHHFVQDDIVTTISLCRCGSSVITT